MLGCLIRHRLKKMIALWKNTNPDPDPDDIRYRGLTPEQRRHREIEKAAYLLWIERAGGHGHDLQDWLDAEKIVDSKRNAAR